MKMNRIRTASSCNSGASHKYAEIPDQIKYDSNLHIYPTKGMNYRVLNTEDKKILDIVIRKFKNYKAKEIRDFSDKISGAVGKQTALRMLSC